MLAKVLSAAVVGIDAYIVKVEVDISAGLPSFSIVGLPDVAVKESRDRVMAAIKNSELKFPSKRITVNLAPADIKKEGASFDLPIALGILAATGQIKLASPSAKRSGNDISQYILLGELSLDGGIRRVKGVLPIALSLRKEKIVGIVLPQDNMGEAAVVDEVKVYPVNNLHQVVEFLNGNISLNLCRIDLGKAFQENSQYELDFSEVKGQTYAKRALEIAAAGGHNVLMIGPPGSGKTMLARRLPTILPEMYIEEALEVTKIHSVTGYIPAGKPLVAVRPFRSPHHTISDIALIGGGAYPKPGEVSLAHNGVLFLDELPEFHRNVLEVLRQPLEDGTVTISRASTSLTYPAKFMLVAAMNPCPCGYYGDPSRECICSPFKIQKYRARVSGPLLDRIDLHLEVPPLKYTEMLGEANGETSVDIRDRVNKARAIQQKRFQGLKHVYCNAHMSSRHLKKHSKLHPESQELLKNAITKLGFSARAYDRILKVSRTVADLEQVEDIQPQHIAEAIGYRSLDKNVFF